MEAELQIATEVAALGRELRASRRRRRMTQAALAEQVGLRQARISELERGEGASAPLRLWASVTSAVGRRLTVQLVRDALEEPADAGHLQVQALVVRLARASGRRAEIEMPTRPSSPPHAVDVMLRDDRERILIAVEIWNRLDDIGAAIRSTAHKVAELEALGIAIGHGRPYEVASCWVMRRTERNMRTIAGYPEIFGARFPGSSRAWVRSLTLVVDRRPRQDSSGARSTAADSGSGDAEQVGWGLPDQSATFAGLSVRSPAARQRRPNQWLHRASWSSS